MECSRIKEYLSDYLEGGLDSRIRELVAGHLRECGDCRRELAALQAMIRELHDLSPVAPPPDFLDQIHERLEARSPLKRLGRALFYPFRVKVPLQLAGAAAMAVLVFSLVSIQRTEPPAVEFARPGALQGALKPPRVEPEAGSAEERQETATAPSPVRERLSLRDGVAEKAVVTEEAAPVRRVELALRIRPRLGREATPAADLKESPVPQKAIRERPAAGPAAGGKLEPAPERKGRSAAPAEKADAAPDTGAARDQIRELAERLGGGMSEFEEEDVAGERAAVLVSVPPARYVELVEGLRHVGAVDGPLPPSPASWAEGRAEVVIRLLPEESRK